MKIKKGDRIYVPETEAYGLVEAVSGVEEDLIVSIKWEGFTEIYDYKYNDSIRFWIVMKKEGCEHKNLKQYEGIFEKYKYCMDCNEKV